jgi:hypothetical protein
MSMNSVYRRLLWLYPAEHRREFGGEMFAVLEDVWSEIENEGLWARTAFCAREFAGLVSGAVREHLRGTALFEMSGLLSTKRLNMRNGFRFPKTTAILMTIILLGVIVAIRKGENIAYSLPHVSQPIAPIHPVHSGLLPPIPLFFAAFYAAGLVGWAILFALRRSGVHRLDNISAEPK